VTDKIIGVIGDAANADAALGSVIGTAVSAEAEANARGHFFTKLYLPHESDLKDFIRLRDLIGRLTMQAVCQRMSQASRYALFEEIEQHETLMESIDQRLLAERDFPNVVATVGKNLALDTYLAGSAYTVVGPYMGLISSTSYSAVAAGDTMTSHAGWLEAGNANTPTYTSPRKTAAWSAASSGSKALSSALSYAMTGTGTVKGCFLVYGSGALTTIDNTAGTLYSAGLFTGGDQPVVNGNTLNVSYTASL
jgi:hypothetical protein